MTREAMEAMGIKALEQESCSDAISRQKEDIAKAFQFGVAFGFGKRYDELDRVIEEIKKVITPQPKTGHWIAYEVRLPDRTILNYRCSVCGRKLIGYSTETLSEAPYCHCGAKMEDEKE
jgi:DNA-directed RNA polymerase subunit RPC12/RpoP